MTGRNASLLWLCALALGPSVAVAGTTPEIFADGFETGGPCGWASYTAVEVDVVLVMDNSSSMTSEAEMVESTINEFAAQLGRDSRLVAISADESDDQGLCVPAPLGSGTCPDDENLPRYRHLVQTVSSSNLLELILSSFGQWSGSLRSGVRKTVIAVSDDDSSLGAAAFTSSLQALDADFNGALFHAIAADQEVSDADCFLCALSQACSSCYCCGPDPIMGTSCVSRSAAEGTVYKQLADDSGGLFRDLCLQQFLLDFQEMAAEILATTTPVQKSCT